jgi:NAD(P)H dehydrogenase (quinone)
MLVHIVYCHPSKNSLTAEIRNAFIKGLVDGGHKYSISDLYQIGFQTDMTEAEYLRDAFYNADLPLSDDVLAEQVRINLFCSAALNAVTRSGGSKCVNNTLKLRINWV